MKTNFIDSFLFLLSIIVLASACQEVPQPRKPNVLFIAIDDLNDWIEPLGGLDISQTPNLNRLASMSMTFTNAHCASPACAPSRIAIMTGVHPAKSDIMKNKGGDGPFWRNVPVLSTVPTLEQFFREKGYSTLAGGKIYHTLAPPRTIINQAEPENWDFWYPSAHVPIPFQVRAPDEVIFPENTIGVHPDYFTWGPIPVEDEKMADYQIVDWANYELSQPHENPFFMAVGITKPHDPWEVPQKYFDQYPLESIPDLGNKKDDLIDAFHHGRRQLHKFITQNDQEKKVIQAYLASIAFVDAMVGRLLDGLERSPYKDNTIIMLWSDHGMHNGEKENWEKFTLWERSTRVPLFVHAPGITTSGSTSSQTVSLLDLYPTLAELIGEKAPTHCDGFSLLPALKGANFNRPPVVMGYQFRNDNAYAVRDDRYRYIYYPFLGLEELYDHQTDDPEWNNIAYHSESKEIINNHRKLLLEKVPGLTWSKDIPPGYQVDKKGDIQNLTYIPLEDMVYKNEWY